MCNTQSLADELIVDVELSLAAGAVHSLAAMPMMLLTVGTSVPPPPSLMPELCRAGHNTRQVRHKRHRNARCGSQLPCK